MKNFGHLFFLAIIWSPCSRAQAPAMDPALRKLSDAVVMAHQKQDAMQLRKLTHSKCPVDEAKLASNLSSRWTSRFQVRVKAVSEVFDLKKIKFVVPAEQVLEYQVWTVRKGFPEMEAVKVYPIAKDSGALKILEYPCYEPI